MIEENPALYPRRQMLTRGYAALSRGDLRGFAAIFDPNVVTVDPLRGNLVGWMPAVAPHKLLRLAFPDLVVDLEEVIENSTRTACRLKLSGTHSVQFGSWAPTGRPVHLEVCEVHEWCEDLVVTTQRYCNELVLLRQLGIIPPVPLAGW